MGRALSYLCGTPLILLYKQSTKKSTESKYTECAPNIHQASFCVLYFASLIFLEEEASFFLFSIHRDNYAISFALSELSQKLHW